MKKKGQLTDACLGFSLLELITALFVLTVGVFGALTLCHVGLDKLRALREANLASRLIENEIETLRSARFADLANTEDAPFRSTPLGLETLVNARASVTIRDAQDPALRLKEITARLTWVGEHGRPIEKALTTFLADKEPAP